MSIIVLGDVLELGVGVNFHLTAGYTLRKATAIENELIGYRLRAFGGQNAEHFAFRFEYNRDEAGLLTHLPPSQWGYSVIEYPNLNPNLNVELAMSLSSSDLHWLFDLVGPLDNPGFRFVPQVFFNFIQVPYYETKSFSDTQAEEIRDKLELLEQFGTFRRDFEHVDKALRDMSQLNQLPFGTPFRFLAMFAIIESLLTHAEPDLSITNQLKSKITLLNHRFQDPMNVQAYFSKEHPLETIVSKLYTYRSAIAHGSSVDFSTGKLQALESSQASTSFLYDLVRKLVVQAVTEPQLVTDLKHC